MDPFLIGLIIVVVILVLAQMGGERNPVSKLCKCFSKSEDESEGFSGKPKHQPVPSPYDGFQGNSKDDPKRKAVPSPYDGFKNNPSPSPYGDGPLPGFKEGFAPTTENDTKPDVVAASEKGQYSEAIKDMALEPTIENSHRRFVDQAHHRTSTASKMTVRADPNDINPWIGLRRPNYRGGAQPMEDTRVISSEAPDQLHEYTRTCLV